MEKKYLYFQPQYVDEFKCDGSKCNARCCKGWNVFIDKKTYEQYSRIEPQADAEKILALIKFNSERGEYLVTMDEKKFCPFLDENNLCRLQRKYGENFLSVTCTSYPRRSVDFGNFFERSLVLTCPVAAEMILFSEEPMQFELVTVPEEIHSHGGKIGFAKVHVTEGFAEHMLEVQIAMISILQERTLTIDQRLIVLGFFLDRLDELTADKSAFTEAEAKTFVDALTKLIAAYESKNFLATQVPHMLATVQFDAKKLVTLTLQLLEKLYGGGVQVGGGQKFMDALIAVLKIIPDADGKVSASQIAANYKALADERKTFSARYSTFLENFLVNELFLNDVPWEFETSIAKNFGVFVAMYKIFELLMFAAVQKNFDSKDDLLTLTNWFINQADHEKSFTEKILELVPNDIFESPETFLAR